MISLFHGILNHKFFIGELKITVFVLIAGYLLRLYILGDISSKSFYIAIIILSIFKIGILDYPYLYLWNLMTIKLNKKFFKNNVFIYGDKKVSFYKRKSWLSFDAPIGIKIDSTIYLDNRYEDNYWGNRGLFIEILEKNYRLKYLENLGNFLEEDIKKEDKIEDIKRKMILMRL